MKLRIFGAEWCTPCKKVKELCDEHDIEYVFKDISVDPEALKEVKELLGGKEPRTIPAIFNEDGYIGGSDQFKQLIGLK